MPKPQWIYNNNHQTPQIRALSCVSKLLEPFETSPKKGIQGYGKEIKYVPVDNDNISLAQYLTNLYCSNFNCGFKDKKAFIELEKLFNKPFEIHEYKGSYNLHSITESEYCIHELSLLGFKFDTNINPEKVQYLNSQSNNLIHSVIDSYYTSIDKDEVRATFDKIKFETNSVYEESNTQFNEIIDQIKIIFNEDID